MKKTVFILFTVWTLCVLAACGGSQTGAKVMADGVDVDLTQMNATIMYAELSNIIYMPEYTCRMTTSARSSA